MSSPSDTTPEPEADALARIGDILANAEREVADVVAAAERDAEAGAAAIQERIRELGQRQIEIEARALEVDRRTLELADLTAGILTTAVEVQGYARRLAAYSPLTDDAGESALQSADLSQLEMPARPAAATPATTPGVVAPTEQAEDAAPVADTSTGGPAPGALRAVETDAWAATALPEPGSPPTRAPGIAPVEQAAPSPAPGPRAVDDDPWGQTPSVDDELPIVAGSDASPDSPERFDSARLIALSMAAEGRSRAEVEAHVRDTLGIVEHGPLIDYVFGGSTPSSVVPSWPPRRRRRSS